MVLSDRHDVGAWRAELFEEVFNDEGSDVLSASSDDKLLDPTGDEKEAIFVDLAEVTTVEVALVVDRLSGGLLILKIAHHDIATTENDFSVTLLVWVV